MQVNIRHRPAYSLAYVSMDSGESLYVERGAMAAMSGGIVVQASTGGGKISGAVARHAFGSESMIFSRFSSMLSGAWVAVSPTRPGDIEVLDLYNEGFLVQSGSLIAYAENVDVSLRYGGVRSVVMQEGVVFLKVSGTGSALIGAYGALERIEIGPGENLIIDTGHLAAFSESMKFTIGPLGSITTAAMSGEGIVAEFTGPGVVYMQTRAESALRNWLYPDRGQNRPR